jgi:hypothetical protein
MLWPKESCWEKNILVSLPVIKMSNNPVITFIVSIFVQLEIVGNLVGNRTTTAITITRFCGWEKL